MLRAWPVSRPSDRSRPPNRARLRLSCRPSLWPTGARPRPTRRTVALPRSSNSRRRRLMPGSVLPRSVAHQVSSLLRRRAVRDHHPRRPSRAQRARTRPRPPVGPLRRPLPPGSHPRQDRLLLRLWHSARRPPRARVCLLNSSSRWAVLRLRLRRRGRSRAQCPVRARLRRVSWLGRRLRERSPHSVRLDAPPPRPLSSSSTEVDHRPLA